MERKIKSRMVVWLWGRKRNPLNDKALRLVDICPGQKVAIFDKNGKLEQKFTVTSWPYLKVEVLYREFMNVSDILAEVPNDEIRWSKKLFWNFEWRAVVDRDGRVFAQDLGLMGIARFIWPFFQLKFWMAKQWFFGHSYGVQIY